MATPPLEHDLDTVEPDSEVEDELHGKVMSRLFGDEHGPSKARVFGRYEVSRQLGAGAMGAVFLARDPELEREVAIKVLHAEVGDSERTFLVAEAKAMARLKHPNVVAIYDVGEQDGEVFLAMERIEGVTLREWQGAGERTSREVVEVYLQAARGLHAAHLAGIIHCDFKPDNVLLGDDGRVTVMDFGLARVQESARERVARSIGPVAEASMSNADLDAAMRDKLTGTPAYMAPESIRGRPSNAVSDQFSFCVALYEALYGERPFIGATLIALMTNISVGERQARSTTTRAPERLWRILDRGLENDPSRRHPSMATLITALERALVPRWRRFVAPLVGMAFVVSAVGGAVVYRSLERSNCADEGARVEELWGSGARERIHHSLLSTELSYAETTFERVDARLTQWSGSWQDVRVDTCEQRAQDSIAIPRLVCLDGQLQELSGLIEVLAMSDPAIADKALGIVSQLPMPILCQDDQWLMTTSSVAVDVAVREEVAIARERLGRVRALDYAGKHEPALKLAREQLATAQALEYVPLEAEAMMWIGHIEDSLGHYPQAETNLIDAYALAIEVDAPQLALEVGVILIQLLGARLDRINEGHIWGRLTLGHAERLGTGAGLLAVIRLRNLAEVDIVNNDGKSALKRIQAASTQAREILEPDDLRHTSFFTVESRAHQLLGDYEEAMVLSRSSIDLIEGVLGPDHPSLGPSLTSLMIQLATLNQLDEAREVATRVLEMQERRLGVDHPEVAGALNNLGNIVSLQGDLDTAASLLERSLKIKIRALGPEHVRVLGHLQNLGTVELQRNNPQRALEYNEQAVAGLLNVRGAEHPEYAMALLNLASAHSALGESRKSATILLRAREVLEATEGEGEITLGLIFFNLTNSYLALEEIEQAEDSIQRALSIFETLLGADHPRVGAALFVYGDLMWRRGENDEAVRMLERSLEILTSTEQTIQSPVEPRFTLAQVRWELGQHEEALALATRARDEAKGAANDGEGDEDIERWIEEHTTE